MKCLLIHHHQRWVQVPLRFRATLRGWAEDHKATLYLSEGQPELDLPGLVKLMEAPERWRKTPPSIQGPVVYQPPQPKARTVIKKNNYSSFIQQAQAVREHLKAELTSGKTVSLEDAATWAQTRGIRLSKGGLSRHLQKVLETTTAAGYTTIKTGRTYRITK